MIGFSKGHVRQSDTFFALGQNYTTISAKIQPLPISPVSIFVIFLLYFVNNTKKTPPTLLCNLLTTYTLPTTAAADPAFALRPESEVTVWTAIISTIPRPAPEAVALDITMALKFAIWDEFSSFRGSLALETATAGVILGRRIPRILKFQLPVRLCLGFNDPKHQKRCQNRKQYY